MTVTASRGNGAEERPILSVVVPTHNRAQTVMRCVESVRAAGHGNHQLELIVVADRCTDGTAELLRKSQPSVLVVETGRQSGCHGSRALGAQHASGSMIFCLDDDNIVEPRCLEQLVDAMQGCPDFGVISAITVKAATPDIVLHRGVQVTYFGRARGVEKGRLLRRSQRKNAISPVDMTPNAFVIRAEYTVAALTEVARFLPHNWSEWGMCFAVRQHGAKTGSIASAVVVHDSDRRSLLTRVDSASIRDQSRSRIVARRMIQPSIGHAAAFWIINFPASLAVYGFHIVRSPRRIRLIREFVAGLVEGTLATVPDATAWTRSSSGETTRQRAGSRPSDVCMLFGGVSRGEQR